MQYVVTNEQMREADRYTIETLAVPSLTLMERAGRALADEAERLAPTGRILCVCGGGNNGGDGFVCARVLSASGREVDCLFFAEKTSEECKANFERWTGKTYKEYPNGDYALIVDCLLGTGFHGELSAPLLNVVQRINASGAKVLSADIPSGVSDGGRAASGAVKATVTLCIGEKKAGCFLREGIDHSGTVKRADIGIVLPSVPSAALSDAKRIKRLLPVRKRYSHKGSYGRAAIVAGSEEYSGAAYLSVAACLRSGVGYTTLYLPEALLPRFMLKAPEALLKTTNEGGRYVFDEKKAEELLAYDAVAFGMGMGVGEETYKGARFLLRRYTGKLILDADAINSIARFGADGIFENKKCDVVVTPHIKEFSRLTGKTVEEILDGGVFAARTFAKARSVTVLLKNAVSLIDDGQRTLLNATGNSGQAKGGSGDVLSGLIVGLCASGASAFDGAAAGAYLAGLAADIAAKRVGEYALTATDVINALGEAFLRVTENADDGGDEE